MTRWSFLLLGGDASDPAVKRMCWRIGLASFIVGFFFGFFQPDPGEDYATSERWILAVLVFAGVAITLYEGCRFYASSDEFVRGLLLKSQARAFGVVLGLLLLYGVLEILFDAPRLPALFIGFGAWILSAFCWMHASWKAT